MFFLRVTSLLFFSSFTEGNLIAISTSENYFLSNAVLHVINQLCLNCNSGLFVFSPSRDFYSSDLETDIISFVKQPIQIEEKAKAMEHHKRFFVLVFVHDFKDFKMFYNQLTIDKFYFNGFFVIVFPLAKPQELNEIFGLLWKLFIYNVNIITQTTKFIEMFTFMPFNVNGKCGDETHVKVNEFSGESMRWQTMTFFPKKFTDLHKCSIKCGMFKLSPAIIIDQKSDGSFHLHGFDVDIFKELLQSINGAVNFTVYPVSTGSIFPNGTVTGLLGRTSRGEVDASLRSWSLQLDRRKLLSETVSHFSDTFIMIMPQPLPLNPLLKFVRPMKLEVWLAIAVLVLIASVVIMLTRLIPPEYYRQLIGRKLRDEYLNILIGFIGSSQNTLPEKNFARFLLMQFLIFCLIVRSLYLGMLFDMLKTDIRSREFTSIHDFYEAGFNFYMYETLAERLDYKEINAR